MDLQNVTYLYHIVEQEQAARAFEAGQYLPTNYAADGFIHCSFLRQVAGVLQRFYAGQIPEVSVWCVDRRSVEHLLRVEAGTDAPDELYPHIYGPIPTGAVLAQIPAREFLDELAPEGAAPDEAAPDEAALVSRFASRAGQEGH